MEENNDEQINEAEAQNEEVSKKKGVLGGIKSALNKGVEFTKKTAADIKHNIDDSIAAKKLEKDIEAAFNKNALVFTLVIPSDKKTQSKKIYAQINYDTKRITLFGSIKITPDMYFVDSNKFKFSIELVRANSNLEIQIGEIIYKRPSTDIDFSIKKDVETIKQVTNIIDNSINIGDNADISKSKIGQ